MAPFGLFLQFPWLVGLDIGIGPVGQAHDQAHGPARITRFIGLGDLLAGGRGVGEQSLILGILVRKPRLRTNLADRLARFTTLWTRSALTLATNSPSAKSMSSTRGESFEA